MFIARLIAITLTLLALTFLVNVEVDPYGANGTGRVSLGRKITDTWAPDFKFSQLARKRPSVVVLGNSRAWMGIAPELSGLPRNSYNFATASLSILDIADELRFAQSCGKLTDAIVILDLNEFEASRGRVVPRLEANARKCAVSPLYTALAYIKENISVSQLFSSVAVAAGREKSNYAQDGSYTPPPGDTSEATAHMYAQQKFEAYLTTGWDYDARARRMRTRNGSVDMYDSFSTMLAFAAQNHVRLTIVFAPWHAQLQILAGLRGMDDAIWAWKRQIVTRAEAAARAGRVEFHVYDFLTVNALTTAPLPQSATSLRPTTSLYYEPSHFRPAIGAAMMREVFGKPAPWELTTTNFERRRQQAAVAYAKYFPEADFVLHVARDMCNKRPGLDFCGSLRSQESRFSNNIP